MKAQLVIIMTFIFVISFGQEWAPIGAEWYYDLTYASSGDIDYHRVYCDSLVSIKGIDCKRINIDYCACNNHFCQKLYTYENDDTIFFYNQDVDSFEILYNFNAESGNEWSIRTMSYDTIIDTVIIHVDSTTTIQINDSSLKKLFVSYIYQSDIFQNEPYIENSEIIQTLGDTRFIINILDESYFACDMDFVGELRCYEDYELGFYSTGIRDSCTYEYTWVFVVPDKTSCNFKVHPNPVSDILIIEGDINKLTCYEIYDFKGILLKRGKESKIDLSSLNNGLYVLKLINQENYFKTINICKFQP